MHRENLRKKLENYFPIYEQEIIDKSIMLKFLDAHEDCFERSLSIGHFTGSCLLENHDGTKFLLTLHKKIGLWLPLGGHADGCSKLDKVAMKEAHEESGLKNIEFVSDNIFDIGIYLIHEYCGTPAHYHYDIKFLLRASDKNEKIKISDESDDLRWFSDLPSEKTGEELSRLIKKWRKLRKIKNNLKIA